MADRHRSSRGSTRGVRVVLLDRDGVINDDRADFVVDVAQWRTWPGSITAIAALNKRGFRVAVCTNQSAVGRGMMTAEDLGSIHAHMIAECAEQGARIDGVYACPHAPDSGCDCRKPAPGLLLNALDDFGVDGADACFVGDSIRDIEAAFAAGCLPILVRTGRGRESETQARSMGVDLVFDDLATASAWLCR